MGHAGAVISGGSGTAEAKIAAMREAGVTVVEGPHLLGRAMKDALGRGGGRPKPKAAASGKRPPAAAKVAGQAAPAQRGGKGARKAAKGAR
jgi:succinyl-CoA synthetase alpha subunit